MSVEVEDRKLEYRELLVKYINNILEKAADESIPGNEKAAKITLMVQQLIKYYEVIVYKNSVDIEILSQLKELLKFLWIIDLKCRVTPNDIIVYKPKLLEFIDKVRVLMNKNITNTKNATTKEYSDSLGYTYYCQKLISENIENIDAVKTINRLKFVKTGLELIPLGGKFKGQYLVRIITQDAFKAWKAAYEAGISCEELVKDKQGRYRTVIYPDGRIAVFTKYAGESLDRYKFKSEKEEQYIKKQVNQIIDQLAKNNINHGHPHPGNFCVLDEEGIPKVRVIDFDRARKYELIDDTIKKVWNNINNILNNI